MMMSAFQNGLVSLDTLLTLDPVCSVKGKLGMGRGLTAFRNVGTVFSTLKTEDGCCD